MLRLKQLLLLFLIISIVLAELEREQIGTVSNRANPVLLSNNSNKEVLKEKHSTMISFLYRSNMVLNWSHFIM